MKELETPTLLSDAADIGGLRFLVVEDRGIQREWLVALLQRLGAAHVLEAADGLAALEILQESGPIIDIVISDVDMPRMDGIELLRRIGESRVGIAVILASALDRALLNSVTSMATEYGVNLLGVVAKPFQPEALLGLIARRGKLAPPEAEGAPPRFTAGEIRAALARAEFEPFFQPKVDIASGQVTGAEVLARWRHPERGIIPPQAFIGTLESEGGIDELTWIMLERSAGQCRAWHEAGLDLAICVNLSARSLATPRLADQVTERVRAQGLEPRRVTLELTESAATTDLGLALENLARLRLRGFGLSIDDYGTGYSSVQQLTRIAFTELKIDRSFVVAALREPSARAVLQSSLALARQLGLITVAEGAETLADWRMLAELGCERVQGFFIARPMEARSVPAWVRRWRAPAP